VNATFALDMSFFSICGRKHPYRDLVISTLILMLIKIIYILYGVCHASFCLLQFFCKLLIDIAVLSSVAFLLYASDLRCVVEELLFHARDPIW